MFELTPGIDGLDNSILMAEAIMKKKADKKKRARKDAATKKQNSGSLAKTSTQNRTKKTKADSISKTSTHSGRTKTSKSTFLHGNSKHNRAVEIQVEGALVVSEVSSDSSFQGGRSSRSFAMSSEIPVFRQSMLVDSSWEKVKAIDGYEEEFGEQIVLHMMEIDPSVRKDLGIKSLRSMRFDEVCHTMAVIVDLIVSLCGPDIDEFEDELTKIGKQCSREGIKVELLGSSVGVAVKGLLPDLPDEDVHAWKVVIDYVVQKMIQAPQ